MMDRRYMPFAVELTYQTLTKPKPRSDKHGWIWGILRSDGTPSCWPGHSAVSWGRVSADAKTVYDLSHDRDGLVYTISAADGNSRA